MKLRIQTDVLHKKLPFLNHAVSSKSQLPVLLNILLQAKGQKLVLSTTDLEIGIELEVPATIEEEGAITVPSKIFSELISSLPSEEITLQTNGTNLEVQGKKNRSVFQTISSEEFPKLYEEKGDEIAVIKSSSMQNDFVKVAFAASSDLGRPALSGILLKKDSETEEVILLVATDGYRLSLKRHKVESANPGAWTIPLLIPSRVIKELILLRESQGSISVLVSKKNNQVMFSQEDTLLIGRLLEAEFPNYERIIPSDFGTRVEFDKEEMQKAVKVCSIFARETANIIRFTIKKATIIVSANTPSVGENTVEVEAKVSGEENEIAFNGRYLLELLSNVDAEQLGFEMTGPLNPGVFKIFGDDSYLHLIMPIRVQA